MKNKSIYASFFLIMYLTIVMMNFVKAISQTGETSDSPDFIFYVLRTGIVVLTMWYAWKIKIKTPVNIIIGLIAVIPLLDWAIFFIFLFVRQPDLLVQKIMIKLKLEEPVIDLSQKSTDEQIEYYLQKIKKNPNDIASYLKLSDIYKTKGDKKKTIEYLQQAYIKSGDENQKRELKAKLKSLQDDKTPPA